MLKEELNMAFLFLTSSQKLHTLYFFRTNNTCYNERKIKKGENVMDEHLMIFDKQSREWSNLPEYNLIFLKSQQIYWNDRLKATGNVFLNEIYDAIGVERTSIGCIVGWLLDGDGDRYIKLENDIITLNFNVDGIIYDKI